MRIYYHLSEYISHRTAGLAYISLLQSLGHTVSMDEDLLEQADLAIVHDEPLRYADMFARHPRLKKVRSIGYCVWEADKPAPAFIPHLELVDEVWTPSSFSLHSLAQVIPVVKLLPHVVRRHTPSKADLAYAAQVLRSNEPGYRFFSIIDALNPRKDVETLLRAFARLYPKLTPKPLLVLKQYRANLDCSRLPGVVSVSGMLSEGQMAALHVLSDAYVSAHHAEGWGLGLSQAMAYSKPVIATGYSGNMEYMDAGNSVPLPYALVPVPERMRTRIPLFTKEMRWAQVDEDALVCAMKRAASGALPPELARNAASITRRFGPQRIAERLSELLHDKGKGQG